MKITEGRLRAGGAADRPEVAQAELAGRLDQDLPRPAGPDKPEATVDPEVVRIRSALLDGVSAETRERTDEERARVLLADLLDWHPRDDKPAWWRHFYLRTLSPAELIGEPDALGGLTGGEVVGQVKKSVLRRFFFPPQEYKFSTGDTACDPATDKQWDGLRRGRCATGQRRGRGDRAAAAAPAR